MKLLFGGVTAIVMLAVAGVLVMPVRAAATPVDATPAPPVNCLTWDAVRGDFEFTGTTYWRFPLDQTFGAASPELRSIFFFVGTDGWLLMAYEFLDGCVTETWPITIVAPVDFGMP